MANSLQLDAGLRILFPPDIPPCKGRFRVRFSKYLEKLPPPNFWSEAPQQERFIRVCAEDLITYEDRCRCGEPANWYVMNMSTGAFVCLCNSVKDEISFLQENA